MLLEMLAAAQRIQVNSKVYLHAKSFNLSIKTNQIPFFK